MNLGNCRVSRLCSNVVAKIILNMVKFYLVDCIGKLCLWILVLQIKRLNCYDTELSLIVGWFEVDLMSDSRFYGRCRVRRVLGYDINRNHVNCGVIVILGSFC